MNHKELLKIIVSLSSNYNQFVDSKDVYKSIPNEVEPNDIYYLVHDLHKYGLIKLESHGYDFRAELTSKGVVYLSS